jgi:hypothetical protein
MNKIIHRLQNVTVKSTFKRKYFTSYLDMFSYEFMLYWKYKNYDLAFLKITYSKRSVSCGKHRSWGSLYDN